jgi:hypothetical protein
MNKLVFTVVCAGTRLKKCANGEQCKEDFENCGTGIILVPVGIRDIASDDIMGCYKTIGLDVPVVVNVSVIPVYNCTKLYYNYSVSEIQGLHTVCL